MRKWIAFALVMGLLVAALPAGAQMDEEPTINCFTEEDAEITMMGGSVGLGFEASQHSIDKFMEACPNITVNLISGPDSTTERLQLYLTSFEAQSSDIDVFQIDVIWPGILVDHLVDLSQYMTEEEMAMHFPAIIENNTVDGSLVGIPWFTDAGILYYRTDLLEKYGYDAPPATWDELTEMAQTIQDGERADGNEEFWGFVWQGNAYEGLTCDALEWEYAESGTRIINPDGTIEVNNDGTIAALERAAGWVGTISPPGVVTYQEEEARAVWHVGNAAFMRNWPYAYSTTRDESDIADVFDVTALPQGEVGGASTLGGWQMAVSKYSENVDAAAALAVYMTSPEGQKDRALIATNIPTIMSLYEDEDILAASPFFGSLYDVFVSAVARPSTVTADKYNEASTLYFTAVHSVLTGDEDADVAMELLELDLMDLMGE
jgi:trehalose/maltose transport system substrate-binding protein